MTSFSGTEEEEQRKRGNVPSESAGDGQG